MISDKKLVQEALMLCIRAHDGQRRKYTGEPYSVHPIGVSKIGKKDRGAISCPFIETLPHVPNSPIGHRERRR